MTLFSTQHQAIEAEQSVLGSVLLSETVMDEIGEMLEPRDFTTVAHELIWKAMQYQYRRNEPIDFLTISNMLITYKRLEDIGGIGYLTQLAESVPTTANAKYYASMVKSRAYKRRGLELADKIIELTNDGEFEKDEDYFQAIEKQTLALRPQHDSNMKHISETKDEYWKYLNQTDDFIFSGFQAYDEWMGGIGRGWLYILAGRPSVGKTARALQMMVNIAGQDQGDVLFWSQEMKANQLKNRMLSPMTNINGNRIRRKQLDDIEKHRLMKEYEKLEKLPIHIEDAKNITIDEVRATARNIRRRTGRLAAIFVDYLTIMRIVQQRGETRSQAVGYVTRTAKQIALEMDCPFIMLAQLSRDGVDEPKLEHLRDSGEIEQDADVVEFLWHDPDEVSKQGKVIQSTIAKGRDVGVNHFKYLFRGWIQKYEEYAG